MYLFEKICPKRYKRNVSCPKWTAAHVFKPGNPVHPVFGYRVRGRQEPSYRRHFPVNLVKPVDFGEEIDFIAVSARKSILANLSDLFHLQNRTNKDHTRQHRFALAWSLMSSHFPWE